MSKRLVAYFSCTGTTAKVAETLAESIGADIFEVELAVPYTAADLDWRDNTSRSSVERMIPILAQQSHRSETTWLTMTRSWWGFRSGGMWHQPSSITFLESCTFKEKPSFPLRHLVGAVWSRSTAILLQAVSAAKLLLGKVFPSSVTKEETNTWFSKLQARLE